MSGPRTISTWVCAFCFVVYGASVADAVTISITQPGANVPNPNRYIKGDSKTFTAELADEGDEDYYVKWWFPDTGDLAYGLSVDHTMTVAGSFTVNVAVYDDPDYTPPAEDTDQVIIWVLWVGIGWDIWATVNNDNAARGTYMNWRTTAPTDSLGTGSYTDRVGWGAEFGGQCNPSSWDQDVILKRYGGDVGGFFHKYWRESTLRSSAPANYDDTSPAAYRDDDPQSGGSGGKVYDVDAPGVWDQARERDGAAWRNRCNFRAKAYWNGRLCSAPFEWYTAQSWKYQNNTWSMSGGIGGDNTQATGQLSSLEWNLQ